MATLEGTRVDEFDISVIIIYFAFILFVGLWMSQKNRGSVDGYFLAGRDMHWVLVGASLFASNVGSLHFVGLAGSGVSVGISNAIFEINAIYVLLLLGWLFLPVYIASGIFTMPEYLKKRFGGNRISIYLAVLSLIMYVFTKISADLYAGAIFIEQSLGWDLYAAVSILVGIAALFTITGGLTAVIWTDFIQTIIMMIGASVLMVIAFITVGGFEYMEYKYARSTPNGTFESNLTCGYPRDDYMHMIRDPVDGDIPWPGIPGLILNSIWYWCADQVIVQRALAAKNYSHAKAGVIMCGYIKFLPLFILVFPGMIARVLYPDEVACVDPEVCREVCGSSAGCSNIAYPLIVLKLMPSGARGIMLAVMLSALMSSLTSIFNSSSTIFTMDLWKRFRPLAKDTELMVVGRLSVIVLVGISILWIPVIQANQDSNLFEYIQQVSAFLQPPICSVFLLAMFWPRLNEQGAFWSLLLGLVVGGVRFVMEFSYPAPLCSSGEPDNRPAFVKDFHYLYFAMCLFAFSLLVAVVVTLMTPPIDEKHLYRLTYWSRESQEERVELDEEDKKEEKPKEKKKTVEEPAGDVAWYTTLWRWVCGIEKPMEGDMELTPEEMELKAIKAKEDISIKEEPFWRNFLNANAIVLCFCAIFITGFFA